MTRLFFARFSTALDTFQLRLSVACGMAAILVAVAGYLFGLNHGFNHRMPDPIEYENVKLASAISKLVYGTDHRYLADMRVYNSLREHGFAYFPQFLDPLGTKFPDNESDVDLLNRGLDAASHLDPSTKMIGHQAIPPNELGGADYYWLAFKLFGIKIQSFFKLYYSIHLASILLFMAAYWRRLDAMMALLAVVTVHFLAQAVIIGFPADLQFNVGTPYSQRFISVLGIVSALHIALAIARPPPASKTSVVLLAAQAALVVFVLSIRGTVMWEILWPATLVAGFVGLVLLHRWRVMRRWPMRESSSDTLMRIISWPVMTFAAIFCLMSVLSDSRTNPLYRFSDEYIPYHAFWISAYVGLGIHPDWAKLYGKDNVYPNGQPVGTDEIPMVAAEKWLEQNYYGFTQQYMLSPITGGWRTRTTERIIREVYLEFLAKHPKFALELHFIYKPRHWYINFVEWNAMAFQAMPLWGMVVMGASFVLLVLTAVIVGWTGSVGLGSVTALLGLGAAWAVVPALLLITSYVVMSDQSMIVDSTLVALFLWLVSLSSRGYRVMRGY